MVPREGAISSNVNKLPHGRGLPPVAGQTLYSLRHTFEDRLTAVEVPDKVAAALMGHKCHRPRYGIGPSLKQKIEWLQRISFEAPQSIWCLVPQCGGMFDHHSARDALWAKFFTAAPARRRRSVARYSDVKRA